MCRYEYIGGMVCGKYSHIIEYHMYYIYICLYVMCVCL